MDAVRQALSMLEDQFAKGIEAILLMADQFFPTVKEPREHLAAELFTMTDSSKLKYWKETQQIEKVKNS